jgi:hypothetical protein
MRNQRAGQATYPLDALKVKPTSANFSSFAIIQFESATTHHTCRNAIMCDTMEIDIPSRIVNASYTIQDAMHARASNVRWKMSSRTIDWVRRRLLTRHDRPPCLSVLTLDKNFILSVNRITSMCMLNIPIVPHYLFKPVTFLKRQQFQFKRSIQLIEHGSLQHMRRVLTSNYLVPYKHP